MFTPHATCRHQPDKEVWLMHKNKISRGVIDSVRTIQSRGEMQMGNRQILYEHSCTVVIGGVLNYVTTGWIPEDQIYPTKEMLITELTNEETLA